PPPGPRFNWRKLARSPRGAVGLAVLAAALLLWPFSGLSWIPWLAGLGALVILRLLRLDGLLRGWDIPLAGLVVVIGLMWSTGPWAWALAASIGVLLAGLAQLPWWRLAAIGAVMCVASGVGFGFEAAHKASVAAAAKEADISEARGQIAEEADRVLPILIQTVTGRVPDPELLCNLLNPAAEAQVVRAVGSDNCAAAAAILHSRLQNQPRSQLKPPAGPPRTGPIQQSYVLDGCATAWASAAGNELGRVVVELVDPNQRTYAVTSFRDC
ncbi:MAG: hypothetical protein ACRD0H_02835, partial [Actinomycetes bacterium]